MSPSSKALPHRFKTAKLLGDDISPSREQHSTPDRADATDRRPASRPLSTSSSGTRGGPVFCHSRQASYARGRRPPPFAVPSRLPDCADTTYRRPASDVSRSSSMGADAPGRLQSRGRRGRGQGCAYLNAHALMQRSNSPSSSSASIHSRPSSPCYPSTVRPIAPTRRFAVRRARSPDFWQSVQRP